MRKQKELEGMETSTAIPELDQAAERLKAASKKRKHAQDAETEAKALLLRLMEDNGIKIYEDHDTKPPLVVVVGEIKKVTVEELKEGGAPVGGEDGDGDEELEDGEPKAPKKELKQRAKKPSPAEA